MSDYYLQFVEAIDEADVTVTNVEAEFIELMLKHRPQELSPTQQAIIRRMAKKYLGEDVQ